MTKETDHFMPLYTDDYLRDTTNLTAEMHGAYLLLLMTCWIKSGVLPDDDTQLAAIARVSAQRWRVLKPIMEAFFQVADGKWTHKRVGKELERARHIIDVRRNAGRRGAATRWQTDDKRIATSVANPLANGQQNDGPSHTTLTQREESKNLTSVVKGALRARKGVDYANPENRQVFARSKITPVTGIDVMMAAEDPKHADHAKAVVTAKTAARKQGVMWNPPK